MTAISGMMVETGRERQWKPATIMNHYYVYILANKRNGTLYTGVTNNLIKRAYEHRVGLVEGFTKKYNVKRLVFFEETTDVESAIKREKQIKKWNRKWKIELIEKNNPEWKDLFDEITR